MDERLWCMDKMLDAVKKFAKEHGVTLDQAIALYRADVLEDIVKSANKFETVLDGRLKDIANQVHNSAHK